MTVRPGAETREELERKLAESLFSKDPVADPSLRVRDFGEVDDQPVRYYLYADVVEELFKAARYRAETATAMLLGRFCMDEQGPFVEVTAFCELEYLYGADLVERTRPRLLEVFEQIREGEKFEGNHVVGVFVGRPGSEGRLDEEVARLHLSLFNLPYQLAVVCDGEKERIGIYGRGPEEPFFNAGFSIVESGAGNKRGDSEERGGERSSAHQCDEMTNDNDG